MLADLQAAIVRALNTNDPLAALAREALTLPQLKAIEPDGFLLSALIVKKLRFERLTRGSRVVESWFDRDARGFTEAFKRYIAEVPATEYFPSGEVPYFKSWCERNSLWPPGVQAS
jgi:hypothetical protein